MTLFCDSFSTLAPFPNGIDSMGVWPQFPYEQPEEMNSVFDHKSPPMKRRKICSDSQFTNQNHTTHPHPPVNQPNGRIFFKTKLCLKFQTGQCKNGENCNFAHGEVDLRKPPPNWQELVRSKMEDKVNNWEDYSDNKMKLCWKFYNGEECPYGPRCNFSHVQPQPQPQPPKFREKSTRFREECSNSISIGSIRSSHDQYANGNGDAMKGNSRQAAVHWKTKLCTKFEVTGHCPFGDNCYYAHGQSELLVPGGCPTETDQSNTHYVPLKSVSAMDIDPIPSKAYVVGLASTQSVQPKNGFMKWKLNKKINRIYGDWIHDQPLSLPNNEE